MRILVTGSSGTIGTELCLKLKEKNHSIVGVDRMRPKLELSGLDEFRQVDLLDQLALETLPRDFDLLIHLAANARVYNLVVNPELALENLITTHRILEFARKNSIRKLLFASSRECYGNQKELPVEEGRAGHRLSESQYTSSKIFGESYCYAYRNVAGLDFKIVRFSNVYGKWDYSDRFIPKLIHTLKAHKPFTIYGEKKSMSFTYIDDCVGGTINVIDHWNVLPEEINVASDTQNKLIDVAAMAKKMIRSRSEITIGDTLPGEVWNYKADISVLRKTGYRPKIDVEQGLHKSIEWYMQRSELPEAKQLALSVA